MGAWTYYSPLWLGSLVAAAGYVAAGTWTDTGELLARVGRAVPVGLATGLTAQAVMFGVQGAFAQVLPVPFGRSLRGPLAVAAGWLVLLAVAAGLVGLLLYGEQLRIAALAAGAVSAAALLAALGVYVWGLPEAERDF